MPEQNQEPLTQLAFEATINAPPYPWAPPGTPTLVQTASGILTLTAPHTWEYPAPGQPWSGLAVTHGVDWGTSPPIAASGIFWAPSPNNYALTEGISVETDPDAASPYDTGTFPVANYDTEATGTLRIYRPIATPAPPPLAIAAADSPRGPYTDGGARVIHRYPVYPPGAVPGETPPTGHVLSSRAAAPSRTQTAPGQIERQTRFANAIAAWTLLTPQERDAWTAAAETTAESRSGKTLYVQIALTRRFDRIRILEIRTGISLTPPP